MDHQQLRSFVAVAQTLNFTQAADLENLTQPAISHHISELEQQLGAKLFDRNSHGVVLTTAGQKYYPYAVSILELAREAQAGVRDIARGMTGTVRISAVPTAARTLTRCLSLFAARYPQIRVELNMMTGRRQIAAINQKQYDFYFSFASLLGTHRSLAICTVEPDRFCLFLPRELEMRVDMDDFSTLRAYTMVSEQSSEGPFLVAKVGEICRRRGLELEATYDCDSFTAVSIFVNAGMGYTILPSSLSGAGFSEHIGMYPIAGEDALVENAVGWERMRENSAAEKFLEVLRELYPVFAQGHKKRRRS